MSLEVNKILDGVGKDAEIVTNENGGKQSKTPMALHLVDPVFLKDWAQERIDSLSAIAENFGGNNYRDYIWENECYRAIGFIAEYMATGGIDNLQHAMVSLETDGINRLTRIAKVLQYGASRYEPNNWRLIPQESHINHALIHILAEIMGDKQDDHIDHALCRLMMAMSTSKSPGFEYNDYVQHSGSIAEVLSDHPDFQPICSEVNNSKPMCTYKYDCDYKEE